MSKSNQATTTEAETKPSPAAMIGELARRLANWVQTNPLQAGIVAGMILLPVAPIVVVQLTLRYGAEPASESQGLAKALEALDRGHNAEAAAIARKLGAVDPLPAEELGGKAFVLGVVAERRAEQLLERSQRRFQLLAASFLEEARALGFPDGREPEGLFLLGKNLYQSGQISASVPVLQQALTLNPRRRSELHHYLAGAFLAESPPQYHQALTHNTEYLADKKLSDAERQAGLLEQARIQFALKQFDACRQTLEQISESHSVHDGVTLLKGRLLSEQARALPKGKAGQPNAERKAAFEQAIETLRAAQGRTAPPGTVAASEYLIGLCLEGLGDEKAALEEFDRAMGRYMETDAGLASGFAAGDLLRRQGRYASAMQRYRSALGALDRLQPRSNAWAPLEELRSRAMEAYQQLLKASQYQLAIELAGLLTPLFNSERSVQLAADASALWGQDLLSQASPNPAAQASELEQQGRDKLRQAGRLYEKLARIRRASREFPDDLYHAAENYLAGHDYLAAIDAFRAYLKAESRRRRPRALIGLGEAQLARGMPDAALVSLKECIDSHSRDAAVFEARLLASQAYLEKGEAKSAEALLLDNLDGEALTPASQEWRESLFALGRLLYQAGRYREAVQRLEEAVNRYPKHPASIEARYLIAESYRRRAQEVREQGRNEATAEGRLARNREATELLETALKNFDLERDELLARQEQGPLSPLEEAILRNCFFARGAVLFELGRYRDAIDAYSSATNRYHRHPEVLQAYVQIAACYRRLGRPVEARSTLEQAKYALKHLPDDAAVDGSTNYSREEWNRILNTLDTL
jgi:tetratricopeptide (TPR) repeat protein